MGGDMLEARLTNGADLGRATDLLGALADAAPHADPETQCVRVPTKGGTQFLLTAGRRFQDEHIDLADLGIRRPSLDDVFLSLTGSATQP
jgi:ABC-2 type transport system ATP-binding protein